MTKKKKFIALIRHKERIAKGILGRSFEALVFGRQKRIGLMFCIYDIKTRDLPKPFRSNILARLIRAQLTNLGLTSFLAVCATQIPSEFRIKALTQCVPRYAVDFHLTRFPKSSDS